MDSKIPKPVQPLLVAYVTFLEKEVPGLVTGLYLHGSLALDAFDARHSDVDYIAVVSRRCTAHDVERLTALHQMLAQSYPRPLFEGSYLQWSDLGQCEEAIEPFPFVHDGILHQSGHFEVNPVTWWLLKHRGLALAGPAPKELNFTVEPHTLLAWMQQNLNTYWVQFIRNPARMAWLFTDYGVQWAVLGVLRQYYTFQEQDIISKIGAGDYALQHLPQRWRRLIQEAINLRTQTDGSLYKFRVQRAAEAVLFLHYVIQECNRRLAH